MASFTHVENFGLHAPRLIRIDGHDPVRGGWRTARRTTQTPRRPNGVGGARGANRSGSASVTSIHAPFTTEVECKMASFTHVENFGVHAPRLIRIDGHDPVRVSLEAPLKYGPELQLGIMQLEREGSPPPGLRLPQRSCHADPIR